MQRKHRDILIIGFFLALGLALILFDASNIVVLQSFGIGLFLVAGSHITRRVLFNLLDMQSIAQKAQQEPVGAAIVFASICGFLVSIMWIGMAVLR